MTNSPRTYAKVPMWQREQDRRNAFVRAALTVIARDGYHATSVGQICAAAKLSSRQFYDLFKSRSDLLDAMFRETADAACQEIDTSDTPLVAVRRYVALLGTDYRVARAMLREAPSAGLPGFAASRDRVRESWRRLLCQACPRPDCWWSLDLHGFIGAVDEITLRWADGPDHDIDAAVDVASMILAALMDGSAAA